MLAQPGESEASVARKMMTLSVFYDQRPVVDGRAFVFQLDTLDQTSASAIVPNALHLMICQYTTCGLRRPSTGR